MKRTYLALGDSYTIGEAVAPSSSFPHQLVQMAQEAGLEIETPQIIAKTGWTTDELMEAIEEETLRVPYDLVSLLIGVNNQYRNYSEITYAQEFETLLQQAIHYAGSKTRVFVLSIPDWGVTPFGRAHEKSTPVIGEEVNRFNEINKRLALDYKVHYTDITPYSREAAHSPEMTASDGLHPSGLMYHGWVKLLWPEVQKSFRPSL